MKEKSLQEAGQDFNDAVIDLCNEIAKSLKIKEILIWITDKLKG